MVKKDEAVEEKDRIVVEKDERMLMKDESDVEGWNSDEG